MKYFSTIILVAALSVLLISCSQSTVTPATSSPTPTATFTPATTPTITFTPTATNIPFPTIIPTINPTELPSLLKSAFSVETLADTNGYILRRISGWSDGFKKRSANPQGYQWMDANHLLLFPIVGEAQSPNWRTTLDRAVVINFETGEIWLPPSDLPISENWMLRFLLPRWSPEAQVLIAAENIGSGNTIKEGASIFKSDGTFVAHYDGRLTSVSPSGNKILIADDIWIELSNGKTVKFKWDEWDGETYTPRWRPIWSLDENQIYFCCYFYGNAKTGESYAFSEENSIFEGKPIRQDESLNHSYGIWLNDTYVLAQADGFYTGFVNFITFDSNFIPIFDPSARTFHNLGEKANLPNAYNIEYIRLSISPKRDYIWITPPSKSESDLPQDI
ncbi:hypothetical protein [Candidatus Villigracilis affinis]|uniref:hypothetical protein n=1 Tax=Candidatus Villigracilis affinis TaxID=3140682 RepID=UPI002A20FFC3|nr:hypothetical protein [Anaerolineales bacterium]